MSKRDSTSSHKSHPNSNISLHDVIMTGETRSQSIKKDLNLRTNFWGQYPQQTPTKFPLLMVPPALNIAALETKLLTYEPLGGILKPLSRRRTGSFSLALLRFCQTSHHLPGRPALCQLDFLCSERCTLSYSSDPSHSQFLGLEFSTAALWNALLPLPFSNKLTGPR